MKGVFILHKLLGVRLGRFWLEMYWKIGATLDLNRVATCNGIIHCVHLVWRR